jgi:glycosyltransferase involved in cell wall biosynthesis
MNKKITIIVPIYNGRKYLKRCLDSIVGQTFGIANTSVILLNDGSTDDSVEIAKGYAEQFPDSIKVFSHKNMGTAKTRNKGISLAKTKYIMFVDQDDFIDSDYCERFYDAAEATGAVVVAGGFRRTNAKKVFYTRRAEDSTWYQFIHAEAWAKIHRTDFVKKVGAEFFNNAFGEDIPFTMQETLSATKFITIDYAGYNWFVNSGSVTQTVHKDFSNLNLSRLLNKLGNLSNSPLTEYYIFVVALYALMVSSIHISKLEFRKNLDEVFRDFRKVVPSFSGNKFIKTRVEGCPLATYLAVRIFVSFYKKGWYNLLYLLNSTQRWRIIKK